jgi:pyridoxal phosphate enzyme (YggS family)
MALSDRLKGIQERIKKATEKSGRSENSVTLVAVTKTVSAERIMECVRLGVKDFGENKIQEAVGKRTQLHASGLRHHFIGHLQTNKARKALEYFDLIQTVDRTSLAETLDRICSEMGKTQRCLVEVKVAKEDTKSGVPWNQAEEFIKSFTRYSRLLK